MNANLAQSFHPRISDYYTTVARSTWQQCRLQTKPTTGPYIQTKNIRQKQKCRIDAIENASAGVAVRTSTRIAI